MHRRAERITNETQMNRRQFLAGTAAAAGCLAMGRSLRAAEDNSTRHRRPNFLFIMADDLSPGHFGYYGNREARTPAIDALAKTGVMFRTCWATPMCAPTRALLVTGRYACRTGIYHNALWVPKGESNPRRFASDHLTFARVLKQHGYATAIAGKIMALGGGVDSPEVGFDEHCFHLGSGKLPGGAEFDGPYEGRHRIPNSKPVASRYWHPCVVRNGQGLKTKPEDFGEDVFADFLIDFMKRNKDKPFLAYFPMNLPHGIAGGGVPTTPLSGRPGKIRGGNMVECVQYIDAVVGRLIKALDELQLRDNTIVFFTTDNADAGNGKTRATEQGARVPMVVSASRRLVRPRGAVDAMTDFADVFPTLLELARAKGPDGYELDGKSLAAYLAGRTDSHRDWIYSYIGTAAMIRDDRWLLEAVDPLGGHPQGRLYDCGNSRTPGSYRDVSQSKAPEAIEARKRLEQALARIPALDPSDPATKQALETYKTAPFRHRLK